MQGADRVRAGGALAFPSRRKIDLDPLLYFAAAGFPREASWRRRWQTAQGSDVKLDDFERADAGQRFEEAVFVRQAHSLVLFGLIAADEDPGRQARRAELTALKDQQWLAGVAEDVIAEIERRKQIDALENALKNTTSAAITKLNTTLSQGLITDRLRARFAQEINDLKLAGLAIEQTKSNLGVARFRVSLIRRKSQNAGDILSEGEYRCVALAGFLAELATNDSGSGIIFDDPVSSLDHMHRDAISARLAKEGRTRQAGHFSG